MFNSKRAKNLTKKLLQYSTASNQEYRNDPVSHPTSYTCPPIPMAFFLLLYSHIFLLTASLCPAALWKPTRIKQLHTCTENGDEPYDWAFHGVHSYWQALHFILSTNFLRTATISGFMLSLGFLNTEYRLDCYLFVLFAKPLVQYDSSYLELLDSILKGAAAEKKKDQNKRHCTKK